MLIIRLWGLWWPAQISDEDQNQLNSTSPTHKFNPALQIYWGFEKLPSALIKDGRSSEKRGHKLGLFPLRSSETAFNVINLLLTGSLQKIVLAKQCFHHEADWFCLCSFILNQTVWFIQTASIYYRENHENKNVIKRNKMKNKMTFFVFISVFLGHLLHFKMSENTLVFRFHNSNHQALKKTERIETDQMFFVFLCFLIE